jgi:hypothetical protein
MQYFRDAVASVSITVNGELFFKGDIDRKSTAYDFSTRTLNASFAPYIRPDRSIKTREGTVDTEFFLSVFEVEYGDDLGDNADGWIRLRYAIDKLLRYYGAVSVEFGNFNKLFSSCIFAPVGIPIDDYTTSGGYGYDGALAFDAWLAAAPENALFDRLLIYQRIMMQDEAYAGPGASTYLDVIKNLCNEIGAVMGIGLSGEGYCIPSYGGLGSTEIAEAEIISVAIDGFIERSPALCACGLVYPHEEYGETPPGMSFVPGATTFGGVRYDETGTHYGAYYSVGTIYHEVLSIDAEVSVIEYMHNPIMGRIPADEPVLDMNSQVHHQTQDILVQLDTVFSALV